MKRKLPSGWYMLKVSQIVHRIKNGKLVCNTRKIIDLSKTFRWNKEQITDSIICRNCARKEGITL